MSFQDKLRKPRDHVMNHVITFLRYHKRRHHKLVASQNLVIDMAKVLLFIVAVLLVVAEATIRESCTFGDSDDGCISSILGYHCCEDNQCYSSDESCPLIQLAGGIIAAIVVGVLVFIGVIVGVIICCCCACCRSSPGGVIVSQPPYQQFGVTTTTIQNAYNPAPPPPQHGYPPQYMQPPQPQMKPV